MVAVWPRLEYMAPLQAAPVSEQLLLSLAVVAPETLRGDNSWPHSASIA
jgi:hypothetical protein